MVLELILDKASFQSLALICLLAFGLRFASITFDSFWLDEAYQTLFDSFGEKPPDLMNFQGKAFLFHFERPHSLDEVMNNFRRVDPLCPPLYPLLLNRWMMAVGTSDLAIRLLSAVFSLCSIVALYFVARKFFATDIARMAALLQAISPFDIYYAQEARMYSLVVLLSVISCGAFLLVLKEHRHLRFVPGWLILYAVSTWGLINAHYTGLFIWAFQIVFGFSWCIKIKQKKLFAWLSTGWIMVFLLWLPWFDLFQQASQVRKHSFYVARVFSWQWPLWALFVRIPANWIFFLAGKRVVAYAAALYFTAAVMLILGFAQAIRAILRQGDKSQNETPPDEIGLADQDRQHDHDTQTPKEIDRRWSYVAFLSWCIFPAIILWALDAYEGRKVVEITRYVIGTSPAVYVIAATGLLRSAWLASTQLRILPPCILFLHAVCALANSAYDHVVPQRQPWRQMASTVESLCAKDDLILVSQYYNIVCLDRYLTRPFRQVGGSPALGQKKITEILENFPKLEQFWLITAQEGESITEMIPPNFKIVKQIDLIHGLHLRLYVRQRS